MFADNFDAIESSFVRTDPAINRPTRGRKHTLDINIAAVSFPPNGLRDNERSRWNFINGSAFSKLPLNMAQWEEEFYSDEI